MSIAQLFQEKSVVFSCEVFPPKKTSPIETVYRTLDQLQDLRPDYISVTFGAGGSAGDNLTGRIAAAIQDQYHIPSVAHLSCVNYTRDEVAGLLDGLKAMGIENILALRGDMDPNHPPKTDFQYASQLIAFIKSRDNSFHLSGACYPEGHIESPDMVSDILNLKKKVDAGAEHLVSQLFFDNDDFYDFREKARIAGINVPIQAGIMPVLNKARSSVWSTSAAPASPRSWPGCSAATATTRRPCGTRASPMPLTRSPIWWPAAWRVSTFTP